MTDEEYDRETDRRYDHRLDAMRYMVEGLRTQGLKLEKFGERRTYGMMPNPRWRWWAFWRPKMIPRMLPEVQGETVRFRRLAPFPEVRRPTDEEMRRWVEGYREPSEIMSVEIGGNRFGKTFALHQEMLRRKDEEPHHRYIIHKDQAELIKFCEENGIPHLIYGGVGPG